VETKEGIGEEMRAALYARVSTDDKGQEVENQLLELRDFASLKKWILTAEYIDHETGAKSDRAQFQQMLAHARQRKFDVLVFWALDRLSREGALHTLQYLELLTSYGVGYCSYTEQYLDSCGIFRDAVISILATIAKQERIRLSERTKAGLARARAKGIRLGRPNVILDRLLITERRAQGASWRAISRELGVHIVTCQKAAHKMEEAKTA
jgi:DNA invertase Pin-like site-specific DNA recombinase